ncbi:methyltransferase domain-containing protein [Couchioplanes caeruleus]|uniref:Methyltransferase domain-containing protein n=2 Tax=Couchioplanes caeruleus TaxID=56438 RepID=A0A1K0GU21_9ACTN|nr:methyltransferase [Couchioplanes caeruleus]OJF12819.1 hypothetical protein BG844_18565 [Couchioplanes caeruleus subsp. caeruleus]ROP30668.1 methyltransferase family protein [Couchioplanes caeruleus]
MSLYDPAPALALVKRHEDVQYPYLCEFGGASLVVDEGVFCPLLTKTSPFLLRCIDFRPGERVLDVFSGTGAFGIVAALQGAHTVTVDRSPKAVDCARRNAERNDVARRVDVRLGDFSTTRPETYGVRLDETFDLVIANPPLLPGAPRDALSGALFDPELTATATFLAVLPQHLAQDGRCYLLTSDVLERFGMSVERTCDEHGLRAEIVDVYDVGYEQYRVHRITRSRG